MSKILAFGEVLWDIIEGEEHLGGAPFNLAAHFKKLGGKSWLVSCIGDDQRGETIRQEIKRLGVYDDFLQTSTNYPTGTVDVKLSGDGIPDFTINKNVAWDHIKLDQQLNEVKSKNFNAFCFGTLAQRNEVSRVTLRKILKNCDFSEILFDVNIRQQYYSSEILSTSLEHTTILKLNDNELGKLSKTIYKNNLSENEFVTQVFNNNHKLKIVCITKGKRGCTVHTRNERFNVPGLKVKVADTVGAGDAFAAAFLFEYLSSHNIKKAAKLAVKIGANVASKRGAIPD